MANILGILTAVVLSISAFIALKNNARNEQELVNKVQADSSLAQSQARLKEAQEVLKALPIERGEVDADVAAKTEEETSLKEGNEKSKGQIEAKTSRIASNKSKLDAIREKTAKVGNIRDLAPKMNAMRAELEELAQSIDDKQATLANLTSLDAATAADALRRKEDLEILSKNMSLPNVKTSIRSIYPTWGFVTLNAGNNAGIATNSTLEIVRDGATIGKLLVTSVESGSASASIVPDSVAQDITLSTGDSVVASAN